MGPQSSGKSTLLNILFSTDFPVMDATRPRQRTTEGLWLSDDSSDACRTLPERLLVLDVEGVDSREMDGKNKTFENRATLFSLAFSSVFIINLDENCIGLNEAACLPLFETVFTAIQKLDQASRKRTLLQFVLRNYNEVTPQSMHLKTIKSMLDCCWRKSRPKEDSTNTWESLFDLQVYCLPNIMPRGRFDAAALGDLPKLFHDPHHPQYVFTNGRGRLFDDVEEIAELGAKLWSAIEQNQELRVEEQRVLIARARCERLRMEVVAQLRAAGERIEAEARQVKGTADLQHYLQGLKVKLKAIVEEARAKFEKDTPKYVQDVFLENRRLLGEHLEYVQDIFDKQCKLMEDADTAEKQAAENLKRARMFEDQAAEQKKKVDHIQLELDRNRKLIADLDAQYKKTVADLGAQSKKAQEQMEELRKKDREIAAEAQRAREEQHQREMADQKAQAEREKAAAAEEHARALRNAASGRGGGGCIIL